MRQPRQCFTRLSRLLKSQQYSAVLKTGKKIHTRGLIFTFKPNEWGRPRLGLVIAKRNVKRAVDRNQVKRVLRECFRKHQAYLGDLDIVIGAKLACGELSKEEIRQFFANFLNEVRTNQSCAG